MKKSLIGKDILEKLKKIKKYNGKITYKDKDNILLLDKKYRKISQESEEIDYKLFLNDKLILSKIEGFQNNGEYKYNKEEYYIFDGYIYNDLESNTELTFHKDGYIYSNDKVKGQNTSYEIINNTLISQSSFSSINAYYDIKLKEVGIIINNKKYKIDINYDIESQIINIIDDYSNKIVELKFKIKQLLEDEIFNKQNALKCYKKIDNDIDEYLKINFIQNQFDNVVIEVNNIKNIYENYLNYIYNAELNLVEIYKINLYLEKVLDHQQKQFLEEKNQKEFKELKKQLMKKYGFKDIN